MEQPKTRTRPVKGERVEIEFVRQDSDKYHFIANNGFRWCIKSTEPRTYIKGKKYFFNPAFLINQQ